MELGHIVWFALGNGAAATQCNEQGRTIKQPGKQTLAFQLGAGCMQYPANRISSPSSRSQLKSQLPHAIRPLLYTVHVPSLSSVAFRGILPLNSHTSECPESRHE